MSAAAPAQTIALPSKRRPIEITPPDRLDDDAYLGQFIPLHYHGQMLADEARLSAFAEAIAKRVPEGAHVVELGGGTGVLSYYAAKRARKVTCIERIPHVAAAARRLLELNGAPNIRVHAADARTFVPDEPADVVICDMLHAGLVRDKQIAVLEDFKARHQAHFGSPIPVIIPEATILAVQPVFQPYEFTGGFLAPVPLFYPAGHPGVPTVELGSPEVYAIVEYARETPVDFAFDRLMTVDRACTVNALRFVTKNIVGIYPEEARTSDWHMAYMSIPLPEPIPVAAGAKIRVSFHYEAGASMQSLCGAIRAEAWRPAR